MQGYLRRVTVKDVDLLYQWDCASVDGDFFQNNFEEYKKQFLQLMCCKEYQQYIYIYEKEAVGQIKLAISGDKAEIKYSICVKKRGMGHEKKLLQLLNHQLKIDSLSIKRLSVNVQEDDVDAKKILLEVGYTKQDNGYELLIKQEDENIQNIFIGGVLYLTNNENTLELYEWLKKRCRIHLYSDRLTVDQIRNMKPELIISYNYKYIISDDVIEIMEGKIVNLHVSYLPWNRGANPNIWSFIDDTPKGVTIHQINAGIDRGKIMYQKECIFEAEKETFITTYQKLNNEIVQLFKEHWNDIRRGDYPLLEQIGTGSYHKRSELENVKERVPFKWSDNIAEFLMRYRESYMKNENDYGKVGVDVVS